MSVQLDSGLASGTANSSAVQVEDLHVALRAGGPEVVHGISFEIAPGEVLGLVGESGSGKTTVGLAMLGHARRGLAITAGVVRVGERDVLQLSARAQRALRGGIVSYVPQDPASSLNPAVRIGTQLSEILKHHGTSSSSERRDRVAELMREVALPDEPAYLRQYPHQLSGGQQQRIGLAMAFACRPRLIVLDEPTTGLDVTTQAHVLSTVRSLAMAHSVAALYVSHDLAVVASLAERVAVMYAGHLVEVGPTRALFESAGHPYTRRLIAAIPHLSGRHALVGIPGRAPTAGEEPPGCSFAPRCVLRVEQCETALPALAPLTSKHEVRCIRAQEVQAQDNVHATKVLDGADVSRTDAVLTLAGVHASYGSLEVLHGIDLQLAAGECLALVGESGSGKTTLARTIAGMHREREGRILLGERELAGSARARDKDARRQIQYIFQNPYGSLNPRQSIGEIVGRPVELFGLASKKREIDTRVGQMLERVSLTADYARRYPDQLSGGERQRVAIARALVAQPSVLVCDEVTSALDVSVQAAIVDLLGDLQRELGLSMLFVTHNLPLVRSIAQRVAVMSEGHIIELGTVEGVLASPAAAYTRELLANTPSLETVAGANVPGQDT